MDFEAFPKIARLKRQIIVTEKIDGSKIMIGIFPINSDHDYNSCSDNPFCTIINAPGDGDSPFAVFAGSRKRWIAPEGTVNINGDIQKGTDNFGFARWVSDNLNELIKLGEGRHYGEWYGSGIQRGYGLTEKRFALFNVARWNENNPNKPECCDVVPILASGDDIDTTVVLAELMHDGSYLVPGFDNPEGIIIYHTAGRMYFKQTPDKDGKWKENR